MDSGSIDHQVTYVADLALHAEIRRRLPHHRVVTRLLRSTYFDSVERDLYRRGISLRERCAIRKNGKVGPVTIEAKIPTSDGLRRVSGPAARLAVVEAMCTENILRTDISEQTANDFQPVAVQMKTRQLFLVSGSTFAPQFVVALDFADASMTDVAIGGKSQTRYEIETQIFTALPWTKKVSAPRIELFRDFCVQLELDFNLCRATESGYQAISMSLA
jgi:hypothetical protein